MAQQDLDGAEIDAGFEQVRSEGMPQRVGMNGFGDAGSPRGVPTSQKDGLGRDGSPGMRAGEQPVGGSLASPIATQQVQQLRRQKSLPILTALAVANLQHVASTVNVAHLELGNFGDPESTRVKGRQQGAMPEIAGRLQKRLHVL